MNLFFPVGGGSYLLEVPWTVVRNWFKSKIKPFNLVKHVQTTDTHAKYFSPFYLKNCLLGLFRSPSKSGALGCSLPCLCVRMALNTLYAIPIDFVILRRLRNHLCFVLSTKFENTSAKTRTSVLFSLQ